MITDCECRISSLSEHFCLFLSISVCFRSHLVVCRISPQFCWVFRGVKVQKMTCRSYHWDFDDDIYRVFSLLLLSFFSLMQHCKCVWLFLYWRDMSSVSCHMNWFLNFENDPCNQMISVCMSLSTTNSFEYISDRNIPIANLSLSL